MMGVRYHHHCVLLTVLLTLSSGIWAQSPSTSTPAPQKRRVTIPPTIVEEPAKMIPFRVGESVELPCVATGEPYPMYYWEMDDKPYDPSGVDGRVAIQPGVGTLIFARPIERDEATYQCFATNQVGTALSVKVFLRHGILESFTATSVVNYRPHKGHKLKLACTPPRSFPKAQVFWSMLEENDRFSPIDFSDRITMDLDGNLCFVEILEEDYQDGRVYACVVQNKVMRSIKHGAHARIYPQGQQVERMAPDIMYHSPTEQMSVRGHTLRMKCIFSGSPTPRVSWSRVNAELPDRSRQESFGQELVIESLLIEDEGVYECQGINEQAQKPIRRSFRVTVEAEPTWIQRPQSVDAAENDKVEFRCEASGIPVVEYHWFLDGVPITKVESDPRRQQNDHQSLTFLNVTKDDAQVIQCNATNQNGYAFTNAYLNVLTEAPIILDAPEEAQRVAEGQTVQLQCRVFGSPKPLVVWRKGYEQLTGGRFKILEEGHLEITDVSLVDAGSYTCTASNNLGIISASGGLLVRRKTLIQTAPKDVMIYEGTEAKFTCTATTDIEEMLNMQIDWKKDGQLIDYRLAQRVFQNDMDNSLTISGTIKLDTGKYSCVAHNGLDEDEVSAQLIVQGAPEAPYGVRVECRNDDGLTEIFWQPGEENYAPILYYTLQYNTTFAPDTWIDISSNVEQKDRSYTLTLSPYSNYTFRVLARNKIGASPPSESTKEVCKETVEARPTTNPENVIGEGDEPGNLAIFWTPMPKIEQNGKGFYYIISWKSRESGGPEDQARVDLAYAWHYVVPDNDDIGIYKAYDVSVKAANAAGESEATVETVLGYSGEDEPLVKPEDVQVVEDSIRSTTAMLTWEHVDTDPEKLRGHMRGYRIQFARVSEWPEGIREQDWLFGDPVQFPRPRPRVKRQIDGGDEDDPEPIDDGIPESGEPIMVPIHHLPADARIRLQVRVLNKYYVGPVSESITFKTQEGQPGPPALFNVVARGSTHFEMSWSKPYDTNGILAGYNISYQTITNLNLGRLQYRPAIFDPEKTRAKLTGLLPDTYYRVYLAAGTRFGMGEHIFLDEKTTPSGPPNPPTFAIVGLNNTWANITWVPSRGGSPGSVFYVQYRPRGWFEWWISADEAMKNYIYLHDLDPGTTYQCRVVAKNGEGYETAAEWQELHTSGTAPGRYVLAKSGWFWGIWISFLIIIIGVIVFIVLKRYTDKWFARKEEEIQDQMRQLQAEEAARQMGIFNQYADTGSREMMSDPSTEYTSDYKGGPRFDEGEEKYSDEEYDATPDKFDMDGAPIPQQGAYGGTPDVGFHPSQAYAQPQPPQYNGKEAAPGQTAKPPGTPTGSAHLSGGQYVLESKDSSKTDTFV